MAIRNFALGPLRGLRRAEARELGNFVVLAGPNGAGKSSLLELLRARRHDATVAEPGTEVLFVGPHRSWRASQLSRLVLHASTGASSYSEVLKNDNLPSFSVAVPGGLNYLQQFGIRTSAGSDDAQAFVKISLVKMNDRQRSLIAAAFDEQHGEVRPGSVPNTFEPFAELVSAILPHLEWVGVDDSLEENIRCHFRSVDEPEQVFDIDELSSGEKAAIALLLPLVERRAELLVEPTSAAAGVVPLTMLLDEPEIHLHPLLQLQVLQYLRGLAARGTAQFILSTHSPTLLDALSDDELYLLSPAALSAENQLSRLTTSQERLEVAREITGSTHLLTRAKPIVFVEGEEERSGLNSDARLVATLLPETQSWALVPGRSKAEVIGAVQRLRQKGLEMPGTPVFGVVDADRDTATDDAHVFAWPIAMIENLLLDAEAIHAALAPFGAQTRATTVAAVRAVLESAAAERTDEEVRLRVQRQLPIGRLALRPDELSDSAAVAKAASEAWLSRLAALDVPTLVEAATAEVRAIVADGQQLERFHGKRLLQAVFQSLNVQGAGLGRAGFAALIAAQEAAGRRASSLATPTLARLRLFMPAGLPEALAVGGDPSVAMGLLAECREHLDSWLAGVPVSQGRAELRRRLFDHARTLDEAERELLVRLAAEIGTP